MYDKRGTLSVYEYSQSSGFALVSFPKVVSSLQWGAMSSPRRWPLPLGTLIEHTPGRHPAKFGLRGRKITDCRACQTSKSLLLHSSHISIVGPLVLPDGRCRAAMVPLSVGGAGRVRDTGCQHLYVFHDALPASC